MARHHVADRSRNLLEIVFDDKGGHRIPFPCDDCHTAPAAYGCIESPGAWLRCAKCWLESKVSANIGEPAN